MNESGIAIMDILFSNGDTKKDIEQSADVHLSKKLNKKKYKTIEPTIPKMAIRTLWYSHIDMSDNGANNKYDTIGWCSK